MAMRYLWTIGMWQDLPGFAGRSLTHGTLPPGTLKSIKVKIGMRLLKEGDYLCKG